MCGGVPHCWSVMLVVHVVVLTSLTSSVSSEAVFHNRDQSDLVRPTQDSSTLHQYSVKTYRQALVYLNKYGYLNCSVPRSKRSLPDMDKLVRETSLQKPRCTPEHIKEGFRDLQRRFKLPVTGLFDAATKETMSSRRCGNSDAVEVSDNTMTTQAVDDDDNVTTTASPQRRVRRDVDDVVYLDHPTLDYFGAPQQQGRVPFTNVHKLKELPTDPEVILERRLQAVHDIRKRRELESVDISDNSDDKQTNMRRNQLHKLLRRRGGPKRLRRRKRRIGRFDDDIFTEAVSRTTKFDKNQICWRLLSTGYSSRIPEIQLKSLLEASFRRFSEVCPIKFQECTSGNVNEVNILIGFGEGRHFGCERLFDGPGGELAHSWVAGNIHFDDSERYHNSQSRTTWPPDRIEVDLLKVAVHEIGHVLGLLHKDDIGSVMYPIYTHNPNHAFGYIEISNQDRRAVQELYGRCRGRYDSVIDWVRKRRVSPTEFEYTYNTYFFRGSLYWLYENAERRPRFGDPLHVTNNWHNLPANMDGYAQVFTSSATEVFIDTYFFKDDLYYKYDDDNDAVYDGYPRPIADDFGPKDDQSVAVPNNIDSVYFDTRDQKLYFFKGSLVYIYDHTLIGRNGCCEAVVQFSAHFPVAEGQERTLTGDISAAYRSFAHNSMYFFVGEDVYVNRGFASGDPANNTLQWMGPSYETWYDLCDPD